MRDGSVADGRGLSLLETVVAIGLFSLCVVLALSLYAGARRTIRSTQERASRQQALRVALDLISRDLRSAGLNIDPDGSPFRPDESIEAAWEHAIVVRGDLDARTPDATIPEADLAGEGGFETVSTGNDEIVGWFLAKPDGSSPGTLRFLADVEPVPRDGFVETVEVRNVSAEPVDPPYTLYRFTVAHGSNRTRRRPVIDGVSALRFGYRDRAELLVIAPGGSDDPRSRRVRGAIHRVRVEIELEAAVGAKGPIHETVGVAEVAPRNRRGVNRE